MKGDNPFHRIRVDDYRIIYETHGDVLLIVVLKIGHRKEVYRQLTLNLLHSKFSHFPLLITFVYEAFVPVSLPTTARTA